MYSLCRLRLFLKANCNKCNIHYIPKITETNFKDEVGKEVKVKGWVRTVRKMKENIFVEITDGSGPGSLQIVIPKPIKPNNLSTGCSLKAEGEIGIAPNNRLELHASNVSVIGAGNIADGEYPFSTKKAMPSEYTRQYLHLRPKTKEFSSLLRLRNLATATIDHHLRNRGFINIHTPILTSNDCEGAGETFIVKPESKQLLKSMKTQGIPEEESFFNCIAYLTVSGQLQLEAAARALTKVYTFGPTFRAENSTSRFHLNEFYMIEAEIAFITQLEEITQETEILLKNIVRDIIEFGEADLLNINAPKVTWLDKDFICLTYDEAITILKNNHDKLEVSAKYGNALSKEHELFLVKHHGNIPIFIINWPKEIKSFYMKECKDDSTKVAAMDLLVPDVGELIGGSLREDDYDKLKLKLPSSPRFQWYLQLRKYGNVPTGGFGMGFERLLQCIFGIPNIKDTIPFPRWPHNCRL
ncbi:asparaginyl-tRNA synthetase [Prorops nasuta]|uniref:asparaginyl-tRNA synthetase n=1 Tax=Prorops nasuta TaxID=863751 RepID=UPI0034CECBAA